VIRLLATSAESYPIGMLRTEWTKRKGEKAPPYRVECDKCGGQSERLAEDFEEARAAAKSAGWHELANGHQPVKARQWWCGACKARIEAANAGRSHLWWKHPPLNRSN
jgi:hypothetical protein